MVKDFGRRVREIAINMMAIIKTIRNGATASSPGRVATFTREITKETCAAAMAKCSGLMAATTRVSGSMESSMDRVHQRLFRRDVCSRTRLQKGIFFQQLHCRSDLIKTGESLRKGSRKI
jgi:hypothetical protein